MYSKLVSLHHVWLGLRCSSQQMDGRGFPPMFILISFHKPAACAVLSTVFLMVQIMEQIFSASRLKHTVKKKKKWRWELGFGIIWFKGWVSCKEKRPQHTVQSSAGRFLCTVAVFWLLLVFFRGQGGKSSPFFWCDCISQRLGGFLCRCYCSLFSPGFLSADWPGIFLLHHGLTQMAYS